jgi:hypothetical protein
LRVSQAKTVCAQDQARCTSLQKHSQHLRRIVFVGMSRLRRCEAQPRSVRKSRLFLLFVVVITFFVPALLTLHGLKARRVDASTITEPEMTGGLMPATAPPPSDDQIMNFAYFIEQGDMTSTLRLNNNMPDSTAATVTLFNSRGESFTAPPLMLPPLDVQRFRLAELLAHAPGDFHSGSVQIFYHGPPMSVTCQVSVASASSHVIFESFPTMSMGVASTRLDGIAWIPDAGTRASAALTNTTTEMLTVNIGSATSIKSLTLDAHETRVMDLKEFLINRQDVGAALIRIEHNGTPGAIIVTGFALNEIRDSVMPSDIESGQVVWFEETVGSLIGRAEVSNPKAGVASSFSCSEPCQCPASFSGASMTPSSSVGIAGDASQFTANEMRTDCHGVAYGPYNRTSDSTWNSDNTNVATVSAGWVTCSNAGGANITAQFPAIIYALNCFVNTINPGAGSSVPVQTPTYFKADSVTAASRCA